MSVVATLKTFFDHSVPSVARSHFENNSFISNVHGVSIVLDFKPRPSRLLAAILSHSLLGSKNAPPLIPVVLHPAVTGQTKNLIYS